MATNGTLNKDNERPPTSQILSAIRTVCEADPRLGAGFAYILLRHTGFDAEKALSSPWPPGLEADVPLSTSLAEAEDAALAAYEEIEAFLSPVDGSPSPRSSVQTPYVSPIVESIYTSEDHDNCVTPDARGTYRKATDEAFLQMTPAAGDTPASTSGSCYREPLSSPPSVEILPTPKGTNARLRRTIDEDDVDVGTLPVAVAGPPSLDAGTPHAAPDSASVVDLTTSPVDGISTPVPREAVSEKTMDRIRKRLQEGSNRRHVIELDSPPVPAFPSPAGLHGEDSAWFAGRRASVESEEGRQAETELSSLEYYLNLNGECGEVLFTFDENERAFSRPGTIGEREEEGKCFFVGRRVYEQLYDHQRIGTAWMFELFKRSYGGILADDMGLGKTIQTAVLLRGLFRSGFASRVLIILPLSVVQQWKQELKKWCGSRFNLVTYHGTAKERKDALWLVEHNEDEPTIMLTTYDTLRTSHQKIGRLDVRRASGQSSGEGTDGAWDVVILDEAHRVKNTSTGAAKAVATISSRCRILLSGTPLMNRLEELWALAEFAQPGLLGDRATFKRCFADLIARGSKRNASALAVERKNCAARELKKLMLPHFLRRTKEEVFARKSSPAETSTSPKTPEGQAEEESPKDGSAKLSMVKKVDIVTWIGLSPVQKEIYEKVLESKMIQQIFFRSEKELKGSRVFQSIDYLKKLCRHPVFLFPPKEQAWRQRYCGIDVDAASASGDNSEASSPSSQRAAPESPAEIGGVEERHLVDDEEGFPAKATDMGFESPVEATEAAEQKRTAKQVLASEVASAWERVKDLTEPQELRLTSPKLMVLYRLLPILSENGHRTLLFSFSTQFLDLIEFAVLTPLKMEFLRIDGSIAHPVRHDIIRHFKKSSVPLMLLTSQVGGVGLNLVAADRVIITDPAWNPALDSQAIDRIHRMGQTRDVVVYRLITGGAIEDHMFRLQIFKQGLFKTAFEAENQRRHFSQDDLKKMFILQDAQDAETLRIIRSVCPENVEVEETLRSELGGADIGAVGFSNMSVLFASLAEHAALMEAERQQAREEARRARYELTQENRYHDD